MKKLLASILATVLGTLALQAQKPALDHSVYDDWKSLSRASVPYDGPWLYYTVSPQQGDGVLTVRNVVDGREWTCPRAADFKISADGKKAVYKIKPAYQETRQARIKKKKPEEMPRDTLAVLDLESGAVEKVPDLTALHVPFLLSDWVAYTRRIGKKDSLLKKEDILVLNIKTMDRDTLRAVSNLTFNRPGWRIAYECKPGAKDTLRQAGVCLYDPAAGVTDTLLVADKKAQLGKIYWNENGDRFAFYANLDTAKAVSDARSGRMAYINVMNRLSVDCDCDGTPDEPDMHDIGVLASTDPVALDQACLDLVWKAPDSAKLKERVTSRNGFHTLEAADKVGLGSRKYELVVID